MVGVFGNQHLRNCCIRRQAAFDDPRGRLRLHDNVFAAPASVFWPAHDEDAELRGNDVEPLADVLADLVQFDATAWASLVFDVDDGLDAWQMRRQRAAVGAALFRVALSRSVADCDFGLCRRAGLVLFGFFEREQHLIFRQRLGAPAEAMALHLLDDLDPAARCAPAR